MTEQIINKVLNKTAGKYQDSEELINNHPMFEGIKKNIQHFVKFLVSETNNNFSASELKEMGFRNIKEYEKTLKNDILAEIEKTLKI